MLSKLPIIDLYILHLVRDPRGVAFSWRKKKKIGNTNEYMLLRGPGKASGLWLTANVLCELLRSQHPNRYLRIRYEDFVERPEEWIRAVYSFVSEEPGSLPFIDPHTVILGRNHAIWGNPNRFSTGKLRIKADNEWMTKMKAADRTIVMSICFPLLVKYKYI